MIYTVTFNPAIDYTLFLPQLKIGEINRTTRPELHFGGKGINVSCVLHELGMQSVALGFIAGFTGNAIEQGMRKDGIMTDFITLSEGMTRINVKLKTDEQTEINAVGPEVDARSLELFFHKLKNLVSGDTLVISGSAAAGMGDDCYCKIISSLAQGVRVVVDATGELLKNTLKYHPFLVKPNDLELAEIVGRKLCGIDDIVEAARQLQDAGAQNVLVSLAQDGAVLLDEQNNVHRCTAPDGELVSAVGAGDSLVAGFLAEFLKSGDFGHALKVGVCCGSATAYSPRLAKKAEIDALFESVK